jgi:hypothetical protein
MNPISALTPALFTATSPALFPPLQSPRIYAYADAQFPNCLKVGFTTRLVSQRMAEHYPTNLPQQTHTVVLDEIATRQDGSAFSDHDVHRVLEARKYKRIRDQKGSLTEWFECDLSAVKAAILEVQTGVRLEVARTLSFGLRPEQQAAIEQAAGYFTSFNSEPENAGKTPHFLWNAKMRFGKTFAAYQLARRMGWTKVLI